MLRRANGGISGSIDEGKIVGRSLLSRILFCTSLALCVYVAEAHAATNRPSGFRTICKQGQTCNVSGSVNVAYGASGSFVMRTLSGTFTCTAATFGRDPIPNKKVKECSIPANATGGSGGGAAPAPTPTPRPAATPTPRPAATPTPRPNPTPTPAPTPPPGPVSGNCTPGMISGTVDCGGRTVGTSCDEQSESQQPVFTLADGATLRNVTLNANAADGIHCLGNCTLQNVVWQDVCEDAGTMRGGAGKVMNIIGGRAANAEDKVFQHNGIGSTMNITAFSTSGSIGKLYRSCGDCSGNGGPRRVNINMVDLERVSSSVAGVNANFGDVARIRNLRIRGYTSGKPKVCVEMRGVVKGNGSTSTIGERFNSAACDVSPSDVTPF